MIDRMFTLILTLFVLIGGTIAIGAEWLGASHDPAAGARTAVLPRVEVTGKRLLARTEIARTESTADFPAATRFTQ